MSLAANIRKEHAEVKGESILQAVPSRNAYYLKLSYEAWLVLL